MLLEKREQDKDKQTHLDDGIRECDCCGETTGDWIEVDFPFVQYLCDVCADV